MGRAKKQEAPQAPIVSSDLRIEYLPLEELRRAPRNPKLHDFDGIGASVARFGYVQPVAIDERTGQLIAGHGRLELLERMREAGLLPPQRIKIDAVGRWCVPTIRGLHFNSDAEAEAYLVADNKWVERGGWDEKVLLEILSAQAPEDLASLGFQEIEVDHLITVREHERRWSEGTAVDDPSAEWNGMPEFDQGDKTAFRTLKIHFEDQHALDAFIALVEPKLIGGQKILENTRFLWFPELKIERYADKRYVAEEEK